jgi:hypothetical protein
LRDCDPECRVAEFQYPIGCLVLLKYPDLATRMFGELWPQGHAGNAGWTVCWDV